MWTIVLLIISNTFMTFAWYGHLKGEAKPIYLAVLLSWGLAFFEYMFMVPANRLGFEKYGFSLTQLKITQEVITLSIFLIFAYFVFGEKLKWNTAVSLLLIVGAVYFAFLGKE
jgi:uncharacterized protein (DUF486 family)